MDWNFLDLMLEQFKFCPKWREWIKACVSPATANVFVNRSPSGEFKLERGLRQGDPLSPFLFLIVAKDLSMLVKRATQCGMLEAVELGSNKVSVSHLHYADDTIFLSSVKLNNVWAMRCILKKN